MGVAIPQVITEDRAAAASVVKGSFSFPKRVGQQKLMYQPQSNGNQATYTVSMWVKNTMPDAIGQNPLWSAFYFRLHLWMASRLVGLSVGQIHLNELEGVIISATTYLGLYLRAAHFDSTHF